MQDLQNLLELLLTHSDSPVAIILAIAFLLWVVRLPQPEIPRGDR